MGKLVITVTLIFCGHWAFSQTAAEIARIDEVRASMLRLAKQNNFDSIGHFYCENAVAQGFDGKREGKKAILEYWSSIQGTGIDWEWVDLEYGGGGEYVYQSGVSKLTLGYGDRTRTFETRFMVLWKEQDSEYCILFDFYE